MPCHSSSSTTGWRAFYGGGISLRCERPYFELKPLPSLASASTIFQLAFAINAIFPVVISDVERLREKAADSLLQKLKEVRPAFKLSERDRLEFIDFVCRSTGGLRRLPTIARLPVYLSVLNCGASLMALYWSAIEPGYGIPRAGLFCFTIITLVIAPLLYFAHSRFLNWLYSRLVRHGSETPEDAGFFADCADLYLQFKANWESHDATFKRLMIEVRLSLWKTKWQIRWFRISQRIKWIMYRIRCMRR